MTDYLPEQEEGMTQPSQSDLRYIGAKRHKVNCTGVSSETAADDLARDLYDKGWRWARITDLSGALVGGVVVNDEGKRTWWGQGPEPKAGCCPLIAGEALTDD